MRLTQAVCLRRAPAPLFPNRILMTTLQVANMFLLPLGLFSGADSSVSWMDIALKNILPVTLGNIVGGAVCQAGLYSAVYGSLTK